MGGEFEILAELVGSFVEDAPKLLKELDGYVNASDTEGVRRIAHSLKSNAADMGAPDLNEISKQLEILAKSGEMDGVAGFAAQITEETGRVLAALNLVLAQGSL